MFFVCMKTKMDALLTVLLTALITVVLVLVVEALFVYILVRTGAVCPHLTRQQYPFCASQHAVHCSSQVTTTSQTEQIDDRKSYSGAVLSQPDEPRVDVISETVPNVLNGSGTDAAVAAAAVAVDAGTNDDRPDSKCSQTFIKTTTAEDQRHYCRNPTGVGCRQPCPSRPCSCWTTVSSDIRYENEENGVVVYQARMIVPSSCQLAPRSRRHWSDSHMTHVKPSTRTSSTRSCPSKVNNSARTGLRLSRAQYSKGFI